MTELDQAKEQRDKLYRRIKEVKAAILECRDTKERSGMRERVRLLNEMYKEACEEVRRLDPSVSRKPAFKKGTSSDVDLACNVGAVWADLEGMTWSQIEGKNWGEVPVIATGRQMKIIQEMVCTAISKCSEMQAKYLHAYYTEELTLEEIGERFGVDVSTVSRTMKRGRARIEQYVTAKLLLNRCVDESGCFDYMKFLNSAGILTERQKEMVYLILSQDTSYRDIAVYVNRNPSTISRTADRAEDKLSGLNVTIDSEWSAVKVKREDWANRSEKELAEDLGLTPAFYYRVVRRGEQVDGIPLFHCAILHKLSDGYSVERAAAALGCSKPLIKRVQRIYQGRLLPDFNDEYHPRVPVRTKLPDNPLVVLGSGDAIIDRIDAATYQALQERFGSQSSHKGLTTKRLNRSGGDRCAGA